MADSLIAVAIEGERGRPAGQMLRVGHEGCAAHWTPPVTPQWAPWRARGAATALPLGDWRRV
jgi:hypothetical protein